LAITYPPTRDIREKRAISWKYQVELVRATPKPRHWQTVRLEDFVLAQDATLKKLEAFLGIPLVKIAVKPEVVGRYKTDTAGKHDFPFFADDLVAYNYAPLDDAKRGSRKPRAASLASSRKKSSASKDTNGQAPASQSIRNVRPRRQRAG